MYLNICLYNNIYCPHKLNALWNVFDFYTSNLFISSTYLYNIQWYDDQILDPSTDVKNIPSLFDWNQ